jgi:hypothetical protein
MLKQSSQSTMHAQSYNPQHITSHPTYLTPHAPSSQTQILQHSCNPPFNLISSSCMSISDFCPCKHCCSLSATFQFHIALATQIQLSAVPWTSAAIYRKTLLSELWLGVYGYSCEWHSCGYEHASITRLFAFSGIFVNVRPRGMICHTTQA